MRKIQRCERSEVGEGVRKASQFVVVQLQANQWQIYGEI